MDELIGSDSRAVAEKKALLCLLAVREAERLGIAITDADIQVMSDEFRQSFGLEDADQTNEWLASAELDMETYARFMKLLTAVKLVQASLAAEIEALIPIYRKVESARLRER